MSGAVPDFAFQAERGMSYKSFASDLMARVSHSLALETHGTQVGGQMSTGVAALQNEGGGRTTGQNVLNMRFALGADDTTYLNSAIAMLFTGTEMDNKQLDLSGLSPPDVQKHIRKAVIAELQSERRKRRKDAVRVVSALTDQIVSYLSIKRVRQMLRAAMDVLFPAMKTTADAADDDRELVSVLLNDDDDKWKVLDVKAAFRKGAGTKGVYYVLLLLEAALDNNGSIGTAISGVITDMVGDDVDDVYIDAEDAGDHGGGGGLKSQYNRLDIRFEENYFRERTSAVWKSHSDVQPPVDAEEEGAMFSMVTARRSRYERQDLGPVGSYTQYCIRRGLVGLKGPLHDDVVEGVGSELQLLEFHEVEQSLSYALPMASMQKISNTYDPTIPTNDIARTYRRGRRQFKSIVHFAPLAELEAYAPEAISNLKGDYAVVPPNPFIDGLEARLAIRWKPVGEIGEKIAKAAAMEHAASRCAQMSTVQKEANDEKLHVIYALMAAGFEMRRLAPHAEVVKYKRNNTTSSCQHSRLVDDVDDAKTPKTQIWKSEASHLCTTPHSKWGILEFAVPYEAGYAAMPSAKDADVVYNYTSETSPSAWEKTKKLPFWNWERTNVIETHPWKNKRTWGQTSEHLAGALKSVEDSQNGLTMLPGLFLGPDANYGYSLDAYKQQQSSEIEVILQVIERFRVFEFRSKLRDTQTPLHYNLIPESNVPHHIEQLRRPRMHAIVRYALLHAHALHEDVCYDEVGDATAQATLLEGSTTQKDERSGIWNDMLREVSISNDRLYTFIRTLSGTMGEDASVLLSSVDDTAQRAARALETERKDIAKRVSDFQAKIVEIIIGGIVKTSHLEMRPDGPDGQFQVVDAEMAKHLRALASGESGRPFFEANVAVQGMINQSRTDKTSLGAVVRGLGGVVSTLYDQLQTELSTATGVVSGGLSMLSQPRNSFMVHLRDDATAAIRVAFDRFSREFKGRPIKLYELIEGCDPHLSLRFAEFVSHVLIQVRSSSGATALYVSEGTRQQTALQARASLMRLTNRASEYTRFSPAPSFNSNLTAAGIQAARMSYFGNSVPGHGGTSQKGFIVRVEGRSDTQGGWQGGYSLPYTTGLRYHPYPHP